MRSRLLFHKSKRARFSKLDSRRSQETRDPAAESQKHIFCSSWTESSLFAVNEGEHLHKRTPGSFGSYFGSFAFTFSLTYFLFDSVLQFG